MFPSSANSFSPSSLFSASKISSRFSSETTSQDYSTGHHRQNFGSNRNQVFDAAKLYLRSKIGPETERLRVGKTPKQKHFTNNELLGPWVGCKIQVPTKFVIGDQDLVYHFPGAKEYIKGPKFKEDVPLLEEPVIMEGVAHFINQEKPQEILQIIVDFISKF